MSTIIVVSLQRILGPDAKKNKKPKEKHGKVTLEKLFRSIGLELEE